MSVDPDSITQHVLREGTAQVEIDTTFQGAGYDLTTSDSDETETISLEYQNDYVRPEEG